MRVYCNGTLVWMKVIGMWWTCMACGKKLWRAR